MGASLGLAGAAIVQAPGKAAARQSMSQQLDSDLRRYASFGDKKSASPGDLAAADWIEARLAGCGYETERAEFPVPTFTTKLAELRFAGTSIAVAPQPVVVPTPEAGITAMGRLVRDAHEACDVAGRIAIVVLPYGRHAAIFSANVLPLIEASARNRAKAIVVVTTGPTGSIISLNTRLTPMASVPIALMAPRDLPAVADGVSNGHPITLAITGTAATKNSCNILGRRVAGPQWLAFSTPRSGWGPCVGERGPGTAIFLELCRWAAVRYPQHSLFAINAGGHELDFAGAHHSLSEGPPPGDTLVWTHLGAGLATRDAVEVVRRTPVLTSTADPQRVMMASPPLIEEARTAFRGLVGYDDPIAVVGGTGELSSIIDRGYARAFAGLGIHRWCHVEDDTIDKVDAELLLPVLEAHRAVIESVVGKAAGKGARQQG